LIREDKRYFSIIRKDKEKSVLIGFALETENEIENAKVKSRKKLRFDRFKFFRDDGAGFGASTNKVTFIEEF
jgi:phosphopantothenoylcysteine decarboxylase/phosphopantothenate--cysteine ligase